MSALRGISETKRLLLWLKHEESDRELQQINLKKAKDR